MEKELACESKTTISSKKQTIIKQTIFFLFEIHDDDYCTSNTKTKTASDKLQNRAEILISDIKTMGNVVARSTAVGMNRPIGFEDQRNASRAAKTWWSEGTKKRIRAECCLNKSCSLVHRIGH